MIQKCTFLKIIIISQYGYQSAYLEVNPTVVMSVTKGNIFEFLSDNDLICFMHSTYLTKILSGNKQAQLMSREI